MNKHIITIALAASLLIACTGMAGAHFTMIFPSDSEATVWDVAPEDYIAKQGETKTVYMMWGHPYEHILFNMASVPEVSVMKPDGTVLQLDATEITVDGMNEEGELGTFKAYKASFTVDQSGDSVVFVKYEDEGENLIDYTKAVIHCGEETWFGWDSKVGQQTEIIPYMRPYGMEEGFVFAGKALYDGKALAGAPVEVEIYHTLDAGEEIVALAGDMFSYDPPMIFTRLTTSNADGEFVYTLDEPGIWFVGATMEPDVETERNVRGVFIVPILDEFPPEEASSASSAASSAELAKAVDEAKAAAEEAKQSAAGTSSTPGFGAILAATGILSALFLAIRRK